MMRSSLLLAFATIFTLAGCGGTVTEGSGSTSGAGGGTTTGGGGGAGGGGVGVGGAGGGGGGGICGGKAGLPCAANEFCAFDDPGTCGNADGTGHCKPRPGNCPDNCSIPMICGCDGKPYCNACDANAAGTDVSSADTCNTKSHVEYSAAPMFTNVARFAIFKVDYDRGICVRLVVEGLGGMGTTNISAPSGWQVSGPEITNAISDCLLTNGYLAPPVAGHVSADGGMGAVTFQSAGGSPPSQISIHATLSFPSGGPPWAPASEPLDADHVPVQ